MNYFSSGDYFGKQLKALGVQYLHFFNYENKSVKQQQTRVNFQSKA